MEKYIESGCRYGYRKITEALEKDGDKVNHKKVLATMKRHNIQGVYPKKKFKYTKTEHKKYPYLLNSLDISNPDEVWATDITYSPYAHDDSLKLFSSNKAAWLAFTKSLNFRAKWFVAVCIFSNSNLQNATKEENI